MPKEIDKHYDRILNSIELKEENCNELMSKTQKTINDAFDIMINLKENNKLFDDPKTIKNFFKLENVVNLLNEKHDELKLLKFIKSNINILKEKSLEFHKKYNIIILFNLSQLGVDNHRFDLIKLTFVQEHIGGYFLDIPLEQSELYREAVTKYNGEALNTFLAKNPYSKEYYEDLDNYINVYNEIIQFFYDWVNKTESDSFSHISKSATFKNAKHNYYLHGSRDNVHIDSYLTQNEIDKMKFYKRDI